MLPVRSAGGPPTANLPTGRQVGLNLPAMGSAFSMVSHRRPGLEDLCLYVRYPIMTLSLLSSPVAKNQNHLNTRNHDTGNEHMI